MPLSFGRLAVDQSVQGIKLGEALLLDAFAGDLSSIGMQSKMYSRFLQQLSPSNTFTSEHDPLHLYLPIATWKTSSLTTFL